MFQSKNTISEIVTLVEELPRKDQQRILRHLKLSKAKKLAAKLDRGKKPAQIFSDQEIADMIHDYRKKTWSKTT
jgi:hypothetical protein